METTATPVCGRHLNLLKAGKSIRLTNTYLSTIITKESNTMNHDYNDSDFDAENDYHKRLIELEGNPFEIKNFRNGGHVMIELCDHEDCYEHHMESWSEASHEGCCGEPNCKHYALWLCLHHTTKLDLTHQYLIANRHINLDSTTLPQEGFIKCEACSFVNNLPHIPTEEQGDIYHRNTTITKEKDMTIMAPTEDNRKPIKGAVKCGHCGNYHATVDEVRACYGAPVIEKKEYAHKKIDTNKYFPTRVEAVRYQIAVKGGKVEYVEGKGWHVTPLHNS